MLMYYPAFWIIQIVWLLLVMVLIVALLDRNRRLESICDDLRVVVQKRSLLTSKEDDRQLLNAWSTSRTGMYGRLMKEDGI